MSSVEIILFAEEVHTAVDGSDAIDFFTQLFQDNVDPATAAPNLIILDINMPVLDGWEFLAEYKKRGLHIKNIGTIFYFYILNGII